jgi:proteic killer suppression protein
VIASFACKQTERLFRREPVKKFPPTIRRRALIKLVLLHKARNLESLRFPPANRLEALKGDRRGQYSIRINQQWRVCFRWKDHHAHDVEIVDYHCPPPGIQTSGTQTMAPGEPPCPNSCPPCTPAKS